MVEIKKYIIPTLFILLGCVIYLTYRQDSLFVSILPKSLLNLISIPNINKDNDLCNFLLYSLPDGLWYASLILIQYSLYSDNILYLIVLHISYALPFVLEFLQFFQIINGTFCIVDLSTYLLTFIILKLWKRKMVL